MPPVVVLRLLPARSTAGAIRRGKRRCSRPIKRAGVEQFIKQQRITRQLARYHWRSGAEHNQAFQRREIRPAAPDRWCE